LESLERDHAAVAAKLARFDAAYEAAGGAVDFEALAREYQAFDVELKHREWTLAQVQKDLPAASGGGGAGVVGGGTARRSPTGANDV
jgi:hypothetical protein